MSLIVNGMDGIDIPDEISLLPLRNTVLFPGVVLPITVGRDKSIKAVNDAYKTDKLIGVMAQKDSNIEDPEIKDLENIGTIAKIIKLIKMPDGGTTVIIQGKSRFCMESILTDDPYFRAKIKSLLDEEAAKRCRFRGVCGEYKRNGGRNYSAFTKYSFGSFYHSYAILKTHLFLFILFRVI